LAPDDPRQGLDLSSPHYADDFSRPFLWGEWSDAAGSILRQGEALVATDLTADGYVGWSTTAVQGADIYVEITVRFGPCQGKDAAGLALRVDPQSADSNYALEVSCDGHFRLRRFDPAGVTDLLPWTAAPALQDAATEPLQIGMLVRGQEIHAFAQGEHLGSAQDPALASGTVGLYANAANPPGVTVTFDDLRLWYVVP
jgi:hypothetical protein